jgi:hypothetical protein
MSNTKTAVSPLDSDIDMGGHRIIGLTGPTGPDGAVTKQYLEENGITGATGPQGSTGPQGATGLGGGGAGLTGETKWTNKFESLGAVQYDEVIYTFATGPGDVSAHLELDTLVRQVGAENTAQFVMHGIFKYNSTTNETSLLQQSGGGTGMTGFYDNGGMFLTDGNQYPLTANLGATGPDIIMSFVGNSVSDNKICRYWATLRQNNGS